MSYWCEISFKKMEPIEIIPFMRTLKRECIERFEEIAKRDASFVPFIRKHLEVYEDMSKVPHEEMIESEAWAKARFTFRYFYLDEFKLLGVFGVPNAVQSLFDATISFQNSCDQDYEREHWEGCDAWTDIYDRWIDMTEKDFQEAYKEQTNDEFDNDTNMTDNEYALYCKRICAYHEIWSHLSEYLFDETESIFVSFFGFYNLYEINRFLSMCLHEYKNRGIE